MVVVAGLAYVCPPGRWSQLVSRLVVAPLERRFSEAVPGNLEGFQGVIALGGHEERIRQGCLLASSYPHLQLFISGAGDEAHVRSIIGSELPCRWSLESKSRNTFENAVYSRRALSALAGSRWLLATSPAHMPRAVGAFRQAGFDVAPWPVEIAEASRLDRLRFARREWVGLLWYWLTGRTGEILPGPSER